MRNWNKEIQGMRALALILVLMYHTETPGFSGGFVGVDVFFCLSGFLITSILYNEAVTEGEIQLPNFYARRIRRLLPSASATICFTLLMGYFLLDSESLSDLSYDATFATVFSANYYFYSEKVQYMNLLKAPSLLLHFWSLAVEEQFYMVWPALVKFGLSKRTGGISFSAFTSLVVIACIVSLVHAENSLSTSNQAFAFFSLSTRVWEFLCGGLLSLWLSKSAADNDSLGEKSSTRLPMKDNEVSPGVESVAAVSTGVPVPLEPLRPHAASYVTVVRQAAAIIGLVFGIFGPMFMYDSRTKFPGFSATLPIMGTVLVLQNPPDTFLGKILSCDIMQILGDASYTIYLLHWPLIAITDRIISRKAVISLSSYDLLAMRWFGMMAAGFLALCLSRYIEGPIRNAKQLKSFRTCAALLVTLICSCLLVAYGGKLASESRAISFVPDTSISDQNSTAEARLEAEYMTQCLTQRMLNRVQYGDNRTQTSHHPFAGYGDQGIVVQDGKMKSSESQDPTLVDTMNYNRHVANLVLYSSSQQGHLIQKLPADIEPPLIDGPEFRTKGGRPGMCEFKSGIMTSNSTLLMVGDSHACSLGFGMNITASHLGMRFELQAYRPLGMFPGTSILAGAPQGIRSLVRPGASGINGTNSPSRVDVLIVHFSFGYGTNLKHEQAVEEFRQLKSIASKRAIFLLDVNRLPNCDSSFVPNCLRQYRDDVSKCASEPVTAIRSNIENAYIRAAREAGMTIVPIMDLLCAPKSLGGKCPLVIEKTILFIDCNHISNAFSLRVGPLLIPRISKAISDGISTGM